MLSVLWAGEEGYVFCPPADGIYVERGCRLGAGPLDSRFVDLPLGQARSIGAASAEVADDQEHARDYPDREADKRGGGNRRVTAAQVVGTTRPRGLENASSRRLRLASSRDSPAASEARKSRNGHRSPSSRRSAWRPLRARKDDEIVALSVGPIGKALLCRGNR